MSTKENSTPRRLKKEAYDTADLIHRAFSKGRWTAPRSTRQRLSIWLKRLTKEAGVNAEGMTESKAYLAAIRALAEQQPNASYKDLSSSIRKVQTITADWIERTRQTEPKPEAKPASKQIVIGICKTCDYWQPLGIFAGDVVTMTPATTDLQPRRIVAVHRHAGPLPNGDDFDAGRFLSFESDQEFDGIEGKHPAIVLEDAEGDEVTFNLDNWTTCHFTATPGNHTRSAEIDTLRRRLEKLDFEPQNEACRFQLETELYQLEQETIADEWPEVIGE